MRLPQSTSLTVALVPLAQLPARKINRINDSQVNFIMNDKSEYSLLGNLNVQEKGLNVNKRKPQIRRKYLSHIRWQPTPMPQHSRHCNAEIPACRQIFSVGKFLRYALCSMRSALFHHGQLFYGWYFVLIYAILHPHFPLFCFLLCHKLRAVIGLGNKRTIATVSASRERPLANICC